MTAKKLRDKKRRRAAKLANQAWEAAEEEDFLFARKLIQRAIGLAPANPRLRCDEGLLAVMEGDDEQAARAFQDAISLAPDFAEAYAELADLRVRQGMLFDAIQLIDTARQYAPTSDVFAKKELAYRQMAGALADSSDRQSTTVEPGAMECPIYEACRGQHPELADNIDGQPWSEVAAELTRRGVVHLHDVAPDSWTSLCLALEHDDSNFAQTVKMDKPRFGRGVYRYFASPLPSAVDAMRRLLYPHLAKIANQWEQTLARQLGQSVELVYPTHWEGFRIRCAHAGQTAPTPLFLTYEKGGFNGLHRDLRGRVAFPIQSLAVLSERLEKPAEKHQDLVPENSFVGGEFVFCDDPLRKSSDKVAVPASRGDIVLFCTASRLVKVGDVFGRRPVQHGMAEVAHGVRRAIAVPFHEYE